MHTLLTSLRRYQAHTPDPEQATLASRFLDLLEEVPRCADRTTYPGHLTGSAVMVSPCRGWVLLTHHKKLDRWLQLGGHADGSFDLPQVALREAAEESGLRDVKLVSPEPWDLDIHWIPEGKEPGHYHYDARYLVVADPQVPIVCSEESHDLRWFSVKEALSVTYGRSMHRLLEKLCE